MLAALHHNYNVDAENSGERRVLRVTNRRGRANNAPNPRTHKEKVNSWQIEIINFIKLNSNNPVIVDEEIDYIDDNLEQLQINQPLNEVYLDEYFIEYFERNIF